MTSVQAAPTTTVETATAAGPDFSSLLAGAQKIFDHLVGGLSDRASSVKNLSDQFDAFRDGVSVSGQTLTGLLASILTSILVCSLAWYATGYVLRVGSTAKQVLRFLATCVLALLAVKLVAVGLGATDKSATAMMRWAILTLFSFAAINTVIWLAFDRVKTLGAIPLARLEKAGRELGLAFSWAFFGVGVQSTLQLWAAGSALYDVVQTLIVSIPTTFLLSWVFWRNRAPLALAVGGERPRSPGRVMFALLWPRVVIGLFITAFFSTQIALTMGTPLPGSAVILTCAAFVALPFADAFLASWALQGLHSRRARIWQIGLRQSLRYALSILVVAMLATMWIYPLAAGLDLEMRAFVAETIKASLIVVIGAFFWNIVSALAYRASIVPEDPATPRSRLETVAPLLAMCARIFIAALVVLSVLLSLGVNVWPFITGFSVFGLAIGFGSQALVKDIVSGLFFLIDDAFRIGEYIEISGAMGTVEKISIRSVSLRHHRGAVATIPYGQISLVQNFSRDWVIEKFRFRVAFDTDIEKVRKLFKKIGQELAENPEFAEALIEPFKSQGISMVEDGTLIISGKYKARPGKTWALRRTVLLAVQKAFQENGIRAVPKPLDASASSAGPQ